MSNYIEYKDSVAFHPGYYIEEIVEESGLSQQDFANRLDTTPKNLSKIINGQQNLSIDMAMKLSKMLGTSLEYWLNLQNAYDAVAAEINSDAVLEEEIAVLKQLGYAYFRDVFRLPDLPKRLAEQVSEVRRFLEVASLTVFRKRDMYVSFRAATDKMDEKTIVKANALVQLAVNEARRVRAPKYDKARFRSAVNYALTLTTEHEGFYPLVKEAFFDAGVVLVVLPNLSGSKINGATKRIGPNVMLMVNDRRLYADSFWFTLLHEAGHILNGDFGISFEGESGERESVANRFAEDALIPPALYGSFVAKKVFNLESIKRFADEIGRDPGIVLGRLQNDGYVRHNDARLSSLRRQYKVSIT